MREDIKSIRDELRAKHAVERDGRSRVRVGQKSMKSCWVVSVVTDDEPFLCGPYTELQAQRLRDSFNRKSERWSFRHQDEDFFYAIAFPLVRLNLQGLIDKFDM